MKIISCKRSLASDNITVNITADTFINNYSTLINMNCNEQYFYSIY